MKRVLHTVDNTDGKTIGTITDKMQISFLHSFKLILSVCLLFFTQSVLSQVTYDLGGNLSYYTIRTFGSAGAFQNAGNTELGMYANGGSAPKQVVAFRTLKTAGDNTGSTRALQVGDVFTVTVSATAAIGEIGFSLNSSGWGSTTWADRYSNSRLYIQEDGTTGSWYVNSSSGNNSLGYNVSTTRRDYMFKVYITSETTCDVEYYVNGAFFSRLFNLTMNGTAGTNIDGFALYFRDDYNGSSNQNIYWKQTTTVAAGGSVNLGYYLTSPNTYTPGIVKNGLAANSTSTSSTNNVNVGGDAGSTVYLSNTNTYTGTTTVNTNARAELRNTSGFGSTSGVTVQSGAALNLYFPSGNNTFSTYSTTINGSGSSGVNGALRSTGGNNTWPGAVTLGSSSRINADATGAAGSLTLSGTVTLGANALTVGGATSAVNISGKITGSGGSLIKDGDNTLTLSNTANDYTGNTFLNAGTLSIANNLSLGTGSLTIGNSTTSGTFAVTGTTSRSQGIIVNNASSAAVIDVASGQNFTLTGVLSQNGGSDPATKIGKAGAGTLTLSGTATYQGRMKLGNGTVIIDNNTALTTNNSTSNRGLDLGLSVDNVVQANNVALLANNGFNFAPSIYVAANTSGATRTIGLNGTGAATFSNEIYPDGDIIATGGSGTVTFSGNIVNPAGGKGIIVSGGTVILSGTNTYTGATTVNTGTLRLTGSLASGSAVSVASGATLTGTGTAAGTVAVSGTISPNTSGTYGTLSTGAMTWNNGGQYIVDISKIPSSGTAGTDWDKLTISGTLTTPGSGNFTVTLNGTIASFSNATPYTWSIGTYTGSAPSTAFVSVNTTGLTNGLNGGSFSINFTGNNINLVFTPLNYTLTYNAGANGSISGTTPQTVNNGANGSTVTAVPNTGYHFTSWSDGVLTAARTDNNITANLTVTASFAINTYTLTYTAGANGSITGTSPQTVNHGANGSAVTAVPDANYHFVDWSDASTANPRTDNNVTANISVTANFALNCGIWTGAANDGDYNNAANWSCGVPATSASVTLGNGTGNVILNSDWDVTGSLDFTNTTDTFFIAPGVELKATGGSINFHDKPVVIQSSENGTGSIGEISGGGSLLGATNVTVERYTAQNAYRGWRMLAVPTQTSQSVFASWQESGVNNNGYGTLVTSPSGAAGYDATTPSWSLLSYVPGSTPAWSGATAATTGLPILNNDRAWMIYIRGDRTVGVSATDIVTNSPAKLRTTGPLFQGDQFIDLVDGFNLVGNPFASEIDFDNIEVVSGSIDNTLQLWDPTIEGLYKLGSFVYFNGGIRNGAPIGSYGAFNTKIQSGMAFIVKSNGASQIRIGEDAKSNGANVNGTGFRPQGGTSVFVTSLSPIVNNNPVYADGVTAAYSSNFNSDIDANDAVKTSNFGESIGMLRNTKLLAIERRQAITDKDSIFYKLSGLKTAKYRLAFAPTSMDALGLTAFLEDKYLSTSKAIDLSTTTYVDFDAVSNNTATFADRFRIVFKAAGTTPVTITNLNATQKNTAMQVDWKVPVENGVKQYEVERSSNGINFTKVGIVPATTNNGGSAVYSFMDVAPVAGTNYYRIKTIDISGAVRFTYIVKVNYGQSAPSITLNSTFINDGRFSLSLTNQERGRYNIRVLNTVGQEVLKTSFEHPGGNSTQTINLPGSVKGIYHLEVIKPNRISEIKKIVVN
ncbi:beta strand repeat-containing protein [Ferruginibacter sp. SUN002]|uniref:beta strand repeat-containing protein n=1 Tax=Ferruginibacter sp. SUN002 TaxID=2937789 RepID=UPI003D36C718